jgi:hypothetical protein
VGSAAGQPCIEALMDEGWANNQIALLITNSRHPAHLEHVDAGTIAEYWLDFHVSSGVFYGHVLGFKGLGAFLSWCCASTASRTWNARRSSCMSGCPGPGAFSWWSAILGCWRKPAGS